MSQIIVALDLPSRDRALALVDALGEEADFYKVGLELFIGAGPSVVRELRERGKRVFLDLKLHDIPNTVARAVEAASQHGAELLTVHASGGRVMLERAAEAADGRVRLLGVTVLTSLGPEELSEAWGRSGVTAPEEVERLARLSFSAGLDGVVASAAEVGVLRDALGPSAMLVTPGIRPAGGEAHDQTRVATPGKAVAAGADALVVGRPVTEAPDPPRALRSIRREAAEARPRAAGSTPMEGVPAGEGLGSAAPGSSGMGPGDREGEG